MASSVSQPPCIFQLRFSRGSFPPPPPPFTIEVCKFSELVAVSNLCIDNFFSPNLTPWKLAQTSFLRAEQLKDLQSRFYNELNEMYVALSGDNEIVGFVEITARKFGLGDGLEPTSDSSSSSSPSSPFAGINNRNRPVVSNLVVKKSFRRFGVARNLMVSCETLVNNNSAWRAYSEIVLQVEDENLIARRFYEASGYEVLFRDPSCRRYDADGLFLRNVRTTKLCLRKKLRSSIFTRLTQPWFLS